MKHPDDQVPFDQLIQAKKRFILLTTILVMTVYFILPVSLTLFPDFMNRKVIDMFSWAWLLVFAQFAMSWLIGLIYYLKMKQFDFMIKKLKT